MPEIELEKSYLAKSLPPDLMTCPHKEIVDVYIPFESSHPVTRIRKKGEFYEITKKQPVKEDDWSEQTEYTIKLTKEEFEALPQVRGKRVVKDRYDYPHLGQKAEIDIFKEDLKGLVLVDFEFVDRASMEAFVIPDFCLVEVTQEKIFAGGMLCGKSYVEIEGRLNELGYRAIITE